MPRNKVKTTFVAIANLSGIACASDSDHTIYQLSKQLPVALAVNAHSPIPWGSVVDGYLRQGEQPAHEVFDGYVSDFENYLKKTSLPKTLKNLTVDDRKVTFLGYGQDDIFPVLCEAIAEYQPETGSLCFKENETTQLSQEHYSAIQLLGDLKNVSTLLWGTDPSSRDFCLKQQQKAFDEYLKRIRNKFKGTKYEQQVEEQLSLLDGEGSFKETLKEQSLQYLNNVLIGIGTFSIQDMVDTAETLVNAEVRLDHLSNGLKAPAQSTSEIAVITRIEGVTWIKHSLFAL